VVTRRYANDAPMGIMRGVNRHARYARGSAMPEDNTLRVSIAVNHGSSLERVVGLACARAREEKSVSLLTKHGRCNISYGRADGIRRKQAGNGFCRFVRFVADASAIEG